jgi:hypothetical protein
VNDRASTAAELDRLREEFPGWEFEAVWFTAATGPDRRALRAHRGSVTVSGWKAEELAAELRQEDS